MRILLCYSRHHFDPSAEGGAGDLAMRGSSANVLAGAWYDVLSQLGDVTYIDPTEHASVAGQSFDLFVGQVQEFSRLLDICDVSRSILFTVNMHPAARNHALRDMVRREGLPAKSLSSWDLVDVKEQRRPIEAADHVVGVGNVAVLNSYLENDVPPSKIKMINYGVGASLERTEPSAAGNRLLYCASDIGLRKGFDVVDGLVRALARHDIDFHLDVVGTAGRHYSRKLERLVADHPGQVVAHGWVSASSREYWEIMRNASFLLAPAVEEGQAGAVLDGMRAGLIPIVSLATGIDFSPLGVLEPALGSESNEDVLLRAMRQTPTELRELRRKTADYYQEFHPDTSRALAEVTTGCLRGSAHPMISVTLPIFNKEKSILRLLENLHAAAIAYGNIELHVIFDGCTDRSEEVVREFFRTRDSYDVTFTVTPNIFEVKTSNIGLRASRGKYCMLLQDDNVIYDTRLFFEATTFLDKNSTAAILGCLAGVNFYPLGTRLDGSGQIAMTEHEVYWRQDAATDPDLRAKFFEVDACMRGPLFIRRTFLEEHGYLDEVYAPLYMDDMDLGFRARQHGSKVYCMLANVENEGLTMAKYDASRWAFFDKVIKANTKLFYERWSPGATKDYLSVERVPIVGGQLRKPIAVRVSQSQRLVPRLRRLLSLVRVLDVRYCRELSDSTWMRRLSWVREQAAAVPAGSTVLDIGAGSAPYREAFAHTEYVTQDLMQTPDLAYGQIDVVSDITSIPLPDDFADVVLCTEVFEHIPEPLAALPELVRLLKPGGRLIFTAPLGSGHHQKPHHYYGGYTRFWYEKFFPEHGLEIVSLEPNGGLYAHTAELLWRGRDRVINPLRAGNVVRKAAAAFLQLFVYNATTLFLHKAEERWLVEDFTVNFFVVAQKQKVEESA